MSEQVRPGFAEFVAARYEALARSAYLLTGDRGLAEDAVQSALVAALRVWDRIDSPDAYVRTVLVRLIGRSARRRWRGEMPSSHLVEFDERADDDLAAAVDLRAALARLPLAQRAVLVLRFFDDLSEKQTADVLGCNVGTVKSRTSRALAALRKSQVLADDPEVTRG